MANLPLARLIQWAYPLSSSELVGAPDWVLKEPYDMQGRTHDNPSEGEIVAMVGSLLADRLKLAAHVEQREHDVYELRRVRADGRIAPGLRAGNP